MQPIIILILLWIDLIFGRKESQGISMTKGLKRKKVPNDLKREILMFYSPYTDLMRLEDAFRETPESHHFLKYVSCLFNMLFASRLQVT